MGGTAEQRTTSDDIGARLRDLRSARGLSQAELGRASGLGRRRIAAIETGKTSVTEADLHALAEACGVDVGTLSPPRLRLAVAAPLSAPRGAELEGDPAIDVLLGEYVAMLVELRGAAHVPASSLREDDLAELALVVGSTPEAIEARLTALIETNDERTEGGRT